MTDSAQQWRLQELQAECDRLISLGRRRTEAEDRWLYDAFTEIAEAYGPRRYHGAKATWPDTGEPDYENPQ